MESESSANTQAKGSQRPRGRAFLALRELRSPRVSKVSRTRSGRDDDDDIGGITMRIGGGVIGAGVRAVVAVGGGISPWPSSSRLQVMLCKIASGDVSAA